MLSLNSIVSSLYGLPPSAALAFIRLNEARMLFTCIVPNVVETSEM